MQWARKQSTRYSFHPISPGAKRRFRKGLGNELMYQFNPSLFNPQQLEAVMHDEGPMLVLAGAGSGKTRIIAHRVAYLIDARHVAPQKIVAVSFTNKAARELSERIADLVGKTRARLCHLSTFHSLGMGILRKHIARLGWKLPFAIISTDEQLAIVRDVLKDMHLQGSSLDPQTLLSFISKVKSARKNPLDMPGMRWHSQGKTLNKFFNQYQIIRKSMNAIDFDDMIALPVDIFEQYPDILAQYTDAWQYLLVDEYQDTNALQFRMLQLLCSVRQNLMVVGDDDQSIYAFRGADSKHILDFPNLFDGVRTIALEQNYRSTQIILDAANDVIARNSTRHEKRLWSRQKDGDKIRTTACKTPEDEAQFVVERIELERAAKNLQYGDFAILYRTNPQSRVFEDILVQRGIPYKIVGSSKFYDQPEIRDTVFYLRVANSLHDELALRRIINTPRRGIAAATLARLDERSQCEKISLFDALRSEAQLGELPQAARMKLREFVDIMTKYHARFAAKSEPLAKTLSSLLDDIHYIAYIQSSSNSDDIARIRRENLDELIAALAAFEAREGRDLDAFLEQLVLDPPRKGEDEKRDEITLMTLHSAKGLEFPFVFIVGCEENLIPHQNSLTEPALSEERRLFYVGITRAKRYLYLTRCLSRRRTFEILEAEPSRFLSDIPSHTIVIEDAADAVNEQIQRDEQAKMRERFAQLRQMFSKTTN